MEKHYESKNLIQQSGKDIKIFDIGGTSQYVVSFNKQDYFFTNVQDARMFAINTAEQFQTVKQMKQAVPLPSTTWRR